MPAEPRATSMTPSPASMRAHVAAEPRPELAAARPVVHGVISRAELAARGLAPADVIDFSASTNPLGPSPAVQEAVATANLSSYPNPTAQPLREALVNHLTTTLITRWETDTEPGRPSRSAGVPDHHSNGRGTHPNAETQPSPITADQIVVGNGSVELIWAVALGYARPAPEHVLIAGPTFGEYERACRLMGAAVSHERVSIESIGTASGVSVARLAARIRQERPRLVWLCNPNNPTGAYLRHADIAFLVNACAVAGALLALDEAYLSFVQAPDSMLDLCTSGHLVLLRSMTKDYALAGLRLGYAVAAQPVAAALQAVLPPWNVSAPAQAAGTAALADASHLTRSQAEVWAARVMLFDELDKLGLRVSPPSANFLLVEVPSRFGNVVIPGGLPAARPNGTGLPGSRPDDETAPPAARFRARLLAYGCVVRDCSSFGLPGHIRIGVRTRPECARLIQAVKQVLQSQEPA